MYTISYRAISYCSYAPLYTISYSAYLTVVILHCISYPIVQYLSAIIDRTVTYNMGWTIPVVRYTL